MSYYEQMENELLLLCEQMQEINDFAESEKRTALTAEEDKKFTKLSDKAESLRRRLREAKAQAEYANAHKDKPEEREQYLPYVHRLSEARAASGKRFREVLTNKGEFKIELRESITKSTDIASAIPVYVGDFVEPLDKGLIFDRLGINIEYGLSGDIKYPLMPYIEATIEDEAIKLEDTSLKPGAINPKPRRCGVTCPMTGLADIQTDMRVYNWVVGALSTAVARLINRWMFMPSPVKTGVYGVFAYNKTDNPVTTATFAAALPTYKELVAMRGKVMSTGAYADGSYAYVMSSEMYTALESTPISERGEKMIISDGKIGGVPVFVTEEIECTGRGNDGKNIYNATAKHVGFGRFTDCKVGQFGQMRLIVNPYTGDTQDVTRITLNTHWAVDCVRYGSFVIGTITVAS